MGDKGFTIQDLLEPLDVTLNIAPSVGSLGQHSPAEAIATEEIDFENPYERAINKIKNFRIFNQVVPLSIASSLNQMWTNIDKCAKSYY